MVGRKACQKSQTASLKALKSLSKIEADEQTGLPTFEEPAHPHPSRPLCRRGRCMHLGARVRSLGIVSFKGVVFSNDGAEGFDRLPSECGAV